MKEATHIITDPKEYNKRHKEWLQLMRDVSKDATSFDQILQASRKYPRWGGRLEWNL